MQKDTRYFLWNTAALLLSYMAVAMPLPAISVFVTKSLGFSNSLSGLAVGIAFLTTILTRGPSGRFSDRKGGKACMTRGLLLYAAASLICAAATLTASPILAFSLLITGRLVLGLGESMALVGMLSWNISLLGPQRSGVVFSLVGASLYGAFAVGGPLGLLCMERLGFTGLMLLCSPLPLLGWVMISRMPVIIPKSTKLNVSFFRIIGTIWRQGVIVGFQGVGFAALGAFISLYFASRGWQHAGLALTFFGLGFVLVRLLFGNFPNKFGGIPVTIVSLVVAACGQMLLWQAFSAEVAMVGAFLTGTGCSLVYPSMGVEVIRKVQPELRGTAVGGFAIFQDMAYGATAPIAGLFADHFGYSVVFMLGFIAALLGLLVAITTAMQRTTLGDPGKIG
jgi:Arabinose efflux permease